VTNPIAVKVYNFTPIKLIDYTFRNELVKPLGIDEPGSVVSEFDYAGWFFCEEIGFFVDSRYMEFVKEIRAELADPPFKGCSHGRRATRNRGCTGPLCAFALRLSQQNQRARRVMESGGIRTYARDEAYIHKDQIASAFVGLGIGLKFR
jgi:hypothetical protein